MRNSLFKIKCAIQSFNTFWFCKLFRIIQIFPPLYLRINMFGFVELHHFPGCQSGIYQFFSDSGRIELNDACTPGLPFEDIYAWIVYYIVDTFNQWAHTKLSFTGRWCVRYTFFCLSVLARHRLGTRQYREKKFQTKWLSKEKKTSLMNGVELERQNWERMASQNW